MSVISVLSSCPAAGPSCRVHTDLKSQGPSDSVLGEWYHQSQATRWPDPGSLQFHKHSSGNPGIQELVEN